ncbi:2-polyprenyl-6-methoxyphenol hydroxylase-like FAD-dependent oxidoreductase [Variovorax boronicumulans]|uniref:flavin-dependent oxidoreductase n=1 Tax=Variovorax boronicumulans TaxID=436515 RepID=UPI002784A466|nr:flavin-dependent oxidoreductase [Variovorax boronicumulans]MDQ0014874.1 2-polyprenyl-6-methoxyphenol hydroxylase-like FAD-dependent oxidoreductase [Variovorax boronicumulans]
MNDKQVIILGAGIGGLTLALSLHQAGIACRVYEAVPELKPLGVGVNLLPHAVRELTELGLLPQLDAVGVRTKESIFFTEHGQLIFQEAAGEHAGYDWPQFSIHRGDLQTVLLEETLKRLGADSVVCNHRCTGVTQDAEGVTVHFADAPDVRGAVAIGCDGIHSALRKQLYPNEGAPRYSGVNMWRGTTRWKPFLSGASMVRAGWLAVGKMVIYPIRNDIDADGHQLVNWVAEIHAPQPAMRDWSRAGRLEDFLPAFADWHFDWLDVPALIRASDTILEYPMVDQDPLPRWTHGRLTLLGDAAHPMVPRGSNGAGQAIIDARFLAGALKDLGVGTAALEDYDRVRVKATTNVVLTNRSNPPDAILREVFERSGGKRFGQIEDVVSHAELQAISDNYKRVAGYDPVALKARASYL